MGPTLINESLTANEKDFCIIKTKVTLFKKRKNAKSVKVMLYMVYQTDKYTTKQDLYRKAKNKELCNTKHSNISFPTTQQISAHITFDFQRCKGKHNTISQQRNIKAGMKDQASSYDNSQS